MFSSGVSVSYSGQICVYCLSHILVQSNFRGYYLYFLTDQAQILLDHLNVLDEL